VVDAVRGRSRADRVADRVVVVVVSMLEPGTRAGTLTVEIVDHLAKEDDGPVVLTAIGAAAVVEIDRFGVTIEQFADSMRALKRGRDAELARKLKEN
jgi:hypothetical protein